MVMSGTVYCDDTKSWCSKEAAVSYKDKHYSLRRLGARFSYFLREDGHRINAVFINNKEDIIVESLWFYSNYKTLYQVSVVIEQYISLFLPFSSVDSKSPAFSCDFKHVLVSPEDFKNARRRNIPPRTSHEVDVQVESTLSHTVSQPMLNVSDTSAIGALEQVDLMLAAGRMEAKPGKYAEVQAMWFGWSLDLQMFYPSPMSNDREPDVINWRYIEIPKV